MSSKKKQVILIALAIVASLTALAVLSTAIAYPTAEHVETARSINAARNDNKLHSSLSSIPVAQYSETAYALAGIVQFLAFIVATFWVYGRIRSRRLMKNPGGITLAIIVTASLISFIVNEFFISWYVMPTGLIEAGIGAYSLVVGINTIITAVVTLLVLVIAEKRYDKKHSFAVE